MNYKIWTGKASRLSISFTFCTLWHAINIYIFQSLNITFFHSWKILIALLFFFYSLLNWHVLLFIRTKYYYWFFHVRIKLQILLWHNIENLIILMLPAEVITILRCWLASLWQKLLWLTNNVWQATIPKPIPKCNLVT